MQNYNQQQAAVILKGIAAQITSMNMPSLEAVNKLFKEFGYMVNTGIDYLHLMDVLVQAEVINRSGVWRSRNGARIYRIEGNEIFWSDRGKDLFMTLVAIHL